MYDAIVLAGGRGSRLGGVAKPQLAVAGQTLLARAVEAVRGAGTIVVVGPEQPVPVVVTWAVEEPPGGGPVAAIAAGVVSTAAEIVVVLAADLPWIAPAVPRLVGAVPPSGTALLVDGGGRANYLASAWRRRDLVAALAAIGGADGAAMRALVALVPWVPVPDEDGWGRDCDTWDDLARARREGGDADA